MTKSSNAFASQGLGSGQEEERETGRRSSKKAKCRLGQAGGLSRVPDGPFPPYRITGTGNPPAPLMNSINSATTWNPVGGKAAKFSMNETSLNEPKLDHKDPQTHPFFPSKPVTSNFHSPPSLLRNS
ncbi:unnamed protein product [Aspergillus oryzae]|uniref:Unnamed protein product n=2 Tax=Aspergillus oryzae TaxID=5062 RepID=A0AAN5C1S4_ASPOZ|nr:unnamed protein product [Aspergillus oryzae]GMF96213.1 unnamed protein product [Aspergillus oryzae]GMG12889.1 unnamed protein product [Aspergillus oryzae]GMG35653.1 unnamed protein product [Aspergillus oryzae]GMG44062.1 unnamed protein product [Aspergillus oryzae var. brunneus]